jgi:hypothetical protein
MFRTHVIVVKAIGFFASQRQHLLCARSEIIHHVATIEPPENPEVMFLMLIGGCLLLQLMATEFLCQLR